LTGLLNRRYWETQLISEFRAVMTTANRHVCCYSISITSKTSTNTYGHLIGDEVLKNFARLAAIQSARARRDRSLRRRRIRGDPAQYRSERSDQRLDSPD